MPSAPAATARSIPSAWPWKISTRSASGARKEGDATIDASGTLPDGKTYRDLAGFRALLNDKKDDFRKALVEELLIYALGRGLEYADRSAVQEICTAAAAQQDRFSGVILAIVNSDLFQKRTATGN